MEKIQYKIEKDNLKKRCRKPEMVLKRMFIYNLMREHDFTLVKIAKTFERNHATIINGLKTYKNLKSIKDFQFVSVLSGYRDFFQQFDIQKIEYSIARDVRNATTFRDIGLMRKRLENNMYHDLKGKRNGGK